MSAHEKIEEALFLKKFLAVQFDESFDEVKLELIINAFFCCCLSLLA